MSGRSTARGAAVVASSSRTTSAATVAAGRVPRRRPVLRPLRLPHHDAAGRRGDATRTHRPRRVLGPARPPAVARAAPRARRGRRDLRRGRVPRPSSSRLRGDGARGARSTSRTGGSSSTGQRYFDAVHGAVAAAPPVVARDRGAVLRGLAPGRRGSLRWSPAGRPGLPGAWCPGRGVGRDDGGHGHRLRRGGSIGGVLQHARARTRAADRRRGGARRRVQAFIGRARPVVGVVAVIGSRRWSRGRRSMQDTDAFYYQGGSRRVLRRGGRAYRARSSSGTRARAVAARVLGLAPIVWLGGDLVRGLPLALADGGLVDPGFDRSRRARTVRRCASARRSPSPASRSSSSSARFGRADWGVRLRPLTAFVAAGLALVVLSGGSVLATRGWKPVPTFLSEDSTLQVTMAKDPQGAGGDRRRQRRAEPLPGVRGGG